MTAPLRLHLGAALLPGPDDTLRRRALRRHQESVGHLGAESIEAQSFAVSASALAKYVAESQKESRDMPVELRFLRLFLLLTVAGPKLIDNYLAKGRFRGEDRTDALQRAFKDLITHNIARLEQGGSDSDDAVQLEELLRINQLLIVHQKSLSSQLVAALRPATTIDYLCLGAACLGGLSLLGWSLWGVIDAHATAIRLNVTHAELQSAQFWQAMPEAARTVNFYRFGSMFGVDCPKVSMGEFELGRGGALRGARAVADVQAGEPLCSISRHAILSWSMAEKAMRILSTAGNVAEHSLLVAWLLRERARARSPHMPYVQACLELAIVEAGSVPWTWEAADPRTERLSAVARQLRQRTRAHAEGDYAAIFGNGRMERFAN